MKSQIDTKSNFTFQLEAQNYLSNFFFHVYGVFNLLFTSTFTDSKKKFVHFKNRGKINPK